MDFRALVFFLGILAAYFAIRRVRKDTLSALSLALAVLVLAASMVLFPEPSFRAAERGSRCGGTW